MAKGIYVGVSSIAKKIKKAYFGVNNVAKKIKKIYIGVGGVAKLSYNAESLPESNIMLYGGNKIFYLNNNKNYSLSSSMITQYSNGSSAITETIYSSNRVSPKGNYFYSNYYSSNTSNTMKIYKLNEGNVSLFYTLTQSDFPSDVIGGSGYKDFYFRTCVFSKDEKNFFILTENTQISSYRNSYWQYVSSFSVEDSKLTHIHTVKLNYYTTLNYNSRYFNIDMAENSPYLAICHSYYINNDEAEEIRRIYRMQINSDKTLKITNTYYEDNIDGTQSFNDIINQSDVKITADGKWIVVYTNSGNSYVTNARAYTYYVGANSLEKRNTMAFGSYFGGFQLSRNKLCGYSSRYNNTSTTQGVLVVYDLNSDGTYTQRNILFPILKINDKDISLLNRYAKLSRDGRFIVGYNQSANVNYVYEIDHTNNALSLKETMSSSSNYQYVALINE